MFAHFHIHQHGAALCHAGEGIYINIEDAAGMNPSTCCEDCRRRYLNIAKMTGLQSAMITIDKALMIARSTQDTGITNRFLEYEKTQTSRM